MAHTIVLEACRCSFGLTYTDVETGALIETAFGGLVTSSAAVPAERYRYHIERVGEGYLVAHEDQREALPDADALLFQIDKQITLALQYRRSDLFFLHAAVVALGERAAVLAAASQTGKSTLTLVALRAGLEYLSDELAPIDLRQLTVEPYPHALGLKSLPPPPHTLPAGTLALQGRFHVPPDRLPGRIHRAAVPVGLIAFLRRGNERFGGLRPLSTASALTHLMEHALNPLAHSGDGLDAAERLSRLVPCCEVDTSDPSAAAATIKDFLRAK